MPNLYQLECQALTFGSHVDIEIRRWQHLHQARATAQRAGQSVRSMLPWRTEWPAPRRADGIRP